MEINRKQIVVLLVATIILSASLTYVLAVSPSNTFWISSGSYPTAATFTIWVEGSNYFVKNESGYIVNSGDNATTLLQYCVDNMPDPTAQGASGTIQFLTGTYFVRNYVNLSDVRVKIKGVGRWGTDIYWGSVSSYLFIANNSQDLELSALVFRASSALPNNSVLLWANSSNHMWIHDISSYGSTNKNMTHFYFTNCYFSSLENALVKSGMYAIYGDGVVQGDIYQTPNCWVIRDLTINLMDTDSMPIYLERCIYWQFDTIVFESYAEYSIFLNASAGITFTNLDIVDYMPDVGIYMTGWAAKQTSMLYFVNPYCTADNTSIEVAGYTGNVTMINPKFEVADCALNFTDTTGVSNFVLINHWNLCTTFVDGKTAYEWNNATYITIP